MKIRKHSAYLSQQSAKRGGALVSVMILCAAILLLVASYLTSLMVQNRLSHRAILHNEARNAAEAVAALALGEVNRITSWGSGYGTYDNPNLLESGAYRAASFDLDPYRSLLSPTGTSRIVSGSLEYKASALSTRVLDHYGIEVPVPLSKDDPVNQGTSDKGQSRRVRTMEIFAKATAKDQGIGGSVTSYVAEQLRLQSGCFFDFNVFGNMDLEFHAGANMKLQSTHVNGDAYITGWADNGQYSLTFTNTLTASGDIYQFIKYRRSGTEGNYYWNPGDDVSGQRAKVYCTKSAGVTNQLINSNFTGYGTNNDSTDPNFDTTAVTNWSNNVRDHSLSVVPYTLSCMENFFPENWDHFDSANLKLRNNGYYLIEPQLSNDPGEGRKFSENIEKGRDPNSTAMEDVKFSALAGFVIEVKPAVSGQQPKWVLRWYQAKNDALPLHASNLPFRGADGKPVLLGTIDPFSDKVDEVDLGTTAVVPGTDKLVKIKRELRIALLKAIVSTEYSDTSGCGSPADSTFVNEFRPTVGSDASFAIRVNPAAPGLSVSQVTDATAYFQAQLDAGRGESIPSYTTAPGIPANSGVGAKPAQNPKYYPVYDRREAYMQGQPWDGWSNYGLKGAFNTLIIDMVKLDEVLNDRVLWEAPGTTTISGYDPKLRFNGIVYVQFPLVPATDAEVKNRIPNSEGGTGLNPVIYHPEIVSDKVRHAVRAQSAAYRDPATNIMDPISAPGYAILVRNAGGSGGATDATGFLPQVTGSTASTLKGGDVGFTLATNGPVYIWGNYNSDGNNPDTADTAADLTDWSTGRLETVHSEDGTTATTTRTGAGIGHELSSLIAADAVTVLGATPYNDTRDFPLMTHPVVNRFNWNDSCVRNKPYYWGGSGASTFTEISTAVIAGITPTRPWYNSVWSGGVHNFVRFLQNWQCNGNTVYAYRGSLVILFESEVAKGYYYDDGIFINWFMGPDLKLGYHQFFAAGNYPPGTPMVNTVRCLNLRDITAAEYEARPSTPGRYSDPLP